MKVGILGAGQLSRMLAQAAQKMDVPVEVLAEKPDEPASFVASTLIAPLRDAEALRRFVADKTHLIFENEFLDCDYLADFGAEKFHPPLAVLKRLQDKLDQKNIFRDLGIPSAKFLELKSAENPEAFIENATTVLGEALVFKWSRLGYDGKGVWVVPKKSKVNWQAAADFIRAGLERGARVYAEKKVNFDRELAQIYVRNVRGNFAAYPMVYSEQRNGVCFMVDGPATTVGLDPEIALRAAGYAQRLAEHFGLEGTFAIEYFLTRKGDFYINELAPRVHNSGHYSQEAADCSQFENHLRAVLGLDLGPVSTQNYFVMANILGPANCSLDGRNFVADSTPANVKVHWYQKKDVRPGRKVGHINGWTKDPSNHNTLKRKVTLDLQNVLQKLEESKT